MSLYLKYRPSDFTNLVWQSFVKETLQKAIANNKTVWAYLFCWPRWTGKTSTARLFAKTVNCEKSINGNPCLKCNICVDFSDDRLIDIIEIDAASHTWVDNIREIIEKAQFSPTQTKYKIYIIDEVHMLSKWAFNALLKILEEPPKHVKFILATTETHKVPETIISRCQRYDFKRISDNDIRQRLAFIAKSENIKTDEKSIDFIIKNSSGWLRNAISTFEQLVSDWEINYETLLAKLEIVDNDILETFLNKLLSKDSSVIEIIDKNIADWKNIKLFFKELLFYIKDISLIELQSWNNITNYIKILDILDETYSKTKHSLDENTTFLIWVLKILNWCTENQDIIVEKKVVSNLKETKNEKKEPEIKQLDKEIENIEISHEDIWDIFSDETKLEVQDSWNFDSVNFIKKLKENWGKWWLTMALRGWNLNMKWNNLIIKIDSKIAKVQVDNIDNISLMINTLSNMWFIDSQVVIK